MLKNRKLWVSGTAATLITLGGIFCGFVPAALPAYSTFSASITSLSAAYFIGNIGAKAFPPTPVQPRALPPKAEG